jgi:hypothetical protein
VRNSDESVVHRGTRLGGFGEEMADERTWRMASSDGWTFNLQYISVGMVRRGVADSYRGSHCALCSD